MKPVADYLKKLLFQYDCIVVPELGGFILHFIPATFIAANGLYMPPRKKIAFNEALKLDDGLLVNYMVLHEGCSRDEALQVIRQFVDELKQEVRQGRIFAIEGLGLFSENEEGKLQFDPEIRHNFQGESYGFQPVSARLVNVVAEVEAPVALLPQPKETAIAVEAEEVPATLVEMPVTNHRRPYLAWAAAVLLVCSLGFFTVKKSPSLVLSSLNPFDSFVSEDEAPAAGARETVVAPSTSIESPTVEVAPKTATAPIPGAKAVEMPVAEPEKPAVVAEPVAAVVAVKKPATYYLAIAGSFASKVNAKRLLRRLRQGGFETAYIMPQTKQKELVKVAASGSTDKNEVLATLDKVSRLSGSRAWVHKIKE
ncbi:hypothetical protein GCM10027299_50080 [Larkinella ripae]